MTLQQSVRVNEHRKKLKRYLAVYVEGRPGGLGTYILPSQATTFIDIPQPHSNQTITPLRMAVRDHISRNPGLGWLWAK